MRIVILVGAALFLGVMVGSVQATGLTENENLLAVTEEFMSRRCIAPIEEGAPLQVDGLSALPADVALNIDERSAGKVWMDTRHHIALLNLEVVWKSRMIAGCRVEFMEPTDEDFEIPFDDVMALYDRWANTQIAQGRYEEVRMCGLEPHVQMRVLENQFPRPNGLPIRVIAYVNRKHGIFFVMAAEAPDAPPGC